MDQKTLKARTKQFALEKLLFCETLPPGDVMRMAARQLMRAASSVGANYRAACRARSKPEFIAKLGIVEEEADETMYWLELIDAFDRKQRANRVELRRLHAEASELLAIVISSIRTARRNR